MPTVIFKPTEACNSNCIYCDGVLKQHRDERMSYELLEKTFFRMNEYLCANPTERIQFTWHGGEPLLLGVEFFRHALEFQQKYCSTTMSRIEHCIQTNLTLINQDYIDIFLEMGITSVGTSFDPIPNVRGFGPKIDSDAYNRLFINGLRLLERNNIGWGVIYVVTRRSLADPRKIFHYLTNLSLTGSINFNAVLVYGEDTYKIAITPLEFADFLGAIFPLWWEYRDRYPNVEPFDSYVKNLIEGQNHLGCCDSGECAYHHVYIGPGGAASHCSRSADWDIIWYGNINDQSLDEILKHEKRHLIQDRNRILPASDCRGCEFWEICHGGCPLDSYAAHGDFGHKSEWCMAKKVFLKKYFLPITKVQLELGVC